MRVIIILALCAVTCYAQSDPLFYPDNLGDNESDFDGTTTIEIQQVRNRRQLSPDDIEREISRREAARREFEQRETTRREVERRQFARRQEEQRIALEIQRQEARFAVIQREADRRLTRARDARARAAFEALIRGEVLRRQMALEQTLKTAGNNQIG